MNIMDYVITFDHNVVENLLCVANYYLMKIDFILKGQIITPYCGVK